MAETKHGKIAWMIRKFVRLSVAVMIALIAGGAYFAWRLQIDEAETFADPVAQFKYGSTGGDRNF